MTFAVSSVSLTIFESIFAVSFAMTVPFSTAVSEFLMSAVVFFAASAVFPAS